MYSGTSSTAALLRKSIEKVDAFTSNGVSTFENNVESALINWLKWNPDARVDDTIAGVKAACTELAHYLLRAGLMPKEEKLEAFRGAAQSAVEAFQAKFGDN